jgi:hypothetical protein
MSNTVFVFEDLDGSLTEQRIYEVCKDEITVPVGNHRPVISSFPDVKLKFTMDINLTTRTVDGLIANNLEFDDFSLLLSEFISQSLISDRFIDYKAEEFNIRIIFKDQIEKVISGGFRRDYVKGDLSWLFK